MSGIHYNPQVWPSLFQIGLIIMLVLFNHIQPDQLIFLCGLVAMTGVYVFHFQHTHGSRCHAAVECVPICLELQYLVERYSRIHVAGEYFCTTAVQKIKQWRYKITRHVPMCCLLANARWSSVQIPFFICSVPPGLNSPLSRTWFPRGDSFSWGGCSSSTRRRAERSSLLRNQGSSKPTVGFLMTLICSSSAAATQTGQWVETSERQDRRRLGFGVAPKPWVSIHHCYTRRSRQSIQSVRGQKGGGPDPKPNEVTEKTPTDFFMLCVQP